MILKALQALLQTYLDAKAKEQERWRETIVQLAEIQKEQWAKLVELEKLRAEKKEVGGLPPELAEARQRLEDRRLAMEEERHRAAMDAEKLRREHADLAIKLKRQQEDQVANGHAPIFPERQRGPNMFNPDRD